VAVFHYKAVAETGEAASGRIEASSRSDAARRLRDQALTPIRISENQTGRLREMLERDVHLGSGSRVKLRALFARDLSTLLSADVPMAEALDIMVGAEKDLARLSEKILTRVRSGISLADALEHEAEVFDAASIALIRGGQRSGQLAEMLLHLAEMSERSLAMKREIRSALIYPAVLVVATCVAFLMLIFYVLPNFEGLFTGFQGALPPAADFVFSAGRGVRAATPYLASGTVVIIVVLGFALQTRKGRLFAHRRVLSLPLVGPTIIAFETARLAHVLGRLLAAGAGFEGAVRLAGKGLGNQALRTSVLDAAEKIEAGGGIGEALARDGFWPDRALRLIRIGERSGSLPDMLAHIARISEDDARSRVRTLIGLIPPVLTIAIGAMVALLIFAILTALLSVNELAFQ